MNVANYYVTTLTNAAEKIGPIVLFIVVGYLLFIKLPFYFAMRVHQENKPKEEEPKKSPSLDQKTYFESRPKIDPNSHRQQMNQRKEEDLAKQKRKEQEREEEKHRQERKKAEREKARAQEELKSKKKEEESKKREKQESKHKSTPPLQTSSNACEIFELKPDEIISKAELKKRYHELLRQNHPDKVAALGHDFKNLAEKKTKEINTAYEELKKKAS
jgi:DnaJ-domain-containing protein 1